MRNFPVPPLAVSFICFASLLGGARAAQADRLVVTAPVNGIVSGGGISCGAGTTGACTTQFPAGIYLTAIPAPGYKFAGWTNGPCAGTGDCSINARDSIFTTNPTTVTLAATFQAVPMVLTITRPVNGGVTSSDGALLCSASASNCSQTYNPGATIRLTATPASAAYVFTGWGGACSGANPTCSLVPNAPTATVTATFAPAASKPYISGSDAVTQGQWLAVGQYVVSPGGGMFAQMLGNGTFCVYPGHSPTTATGASLWCANTAQPAGNYYAVMQADGNFCIAKGTDPQNGQGGVWCSSSNGATGATIAYSLGLSDGGQVQIYQGAYPTTPGAPLMWSSPKAPMTAALFAYLSSIGVHPAPDLTRQQTFVANQSQMGAAGYPHSQPCGLAYTVPSNVNLVYVKATGGRGSRSMMEITQPGGFGASVSGLLAVTPGQTLYVVPAFNGTVLPGYPGGGSSKLGGGQGGGVSFVSTQAPSWMNSTDIICSAPQGALLVVAGGGGGGGLPGTGAASSPGTGGSAGLLNGGGSTGGSSNCLGGCGGGGGGGGTQTGGGATGTHPGCGSEQRYGGSYMRGGDTYAKGGGGGAGLWGGGSGGEGDSCNVLATPGGGGGGSSWITPTAFGPTSALDSGASSTAGVVIAPAVY